jgi:hypothetical protein
MPAPTVRLLLDHLAPRSGSRAWHGGPTPVGAVRGVDHRMAAWRPAPGRKSIWELMLHIAYWKYTLRRHLATDPIPRFPRSPANFPRQPARPDAASWTADIALLRREHELLAEALTSLPEGRLGRIPRKGKRWTYGDMLVGIAMHDAYHTGQIQLLKRLFRKRSEE